MRKEKNIGHRRPRIGRGEVGVDIGKTKHGTGAHPLTGQILMPFTRRKKTKEGDQIPNGENIGLHVNTLGSYRASQKKEQSAPFPKRRRNGVTHFQRPEALVPYLGLPSYLGPLP